MSPKKQPSMTSNSISLRNNLAASWRALDPAWRWAIGVFVVARVFYTLWSLVILLLVPSLLQNLDLFGVPVIAYFNLSTSERFVYSRQVNDHVLNFRPNDDGTMTDVETASVWSLRDGVAVSGAMTGTKLATAQYTAQDLYPYQGVEAERGFLGVWQRFDTNWYLKIAEQGYAPEDGSMAFFPLYPVLIQVVGSLFFGQYLLAGFAISSVGLIASLYVLYRMTEEVADASAAKRVLVILVMFPSAFFLFAVYTEALFLSLVLASIFFAHREKWELGILFGTLAAATRLQAVLLLAPLAYLWWSQRNSDSKASQKVLHMGSLLLLPLPALLFLLLGRGALFSSLTAQWQARFVLPTETLTSAVNLLFSGQATLILWLNLAVTLLFATMLLPVLWRLPRVYFVYTLVMFLWPFFRLTPSQPLVSMWRYVLPIFPVFIIWGIAGRNPWIQRAIVYLSLPLNLYFSAQFFVWGWVA
jgi:hypothetical protein